VLKVFFFMVSQMLGTPPALIPSKEVFVRRRPLTD
jgi:hypothetical protein